MTDICIICGAPVTEGRQVCWQCEHNIMEWKPMDETNIELKLNDNDHEIGSLKHRIDDVENRQNALDKLAESIGRMDKRRSCLRMSRRQNRASVHAA